MEEHSTSLGTKLASLMWRVLSRYGEVKHRYLLPIYRALGLLPSQIKPKGTFDQSATLRSAQAISTFLNRGSFSNQAKALTDRLKERKGAVIFPPSVGWEIANTQRTNHIAREFANRGYVAIFDSSNSFDDVSGFREVEPDVFLFRGSHQMLPEISSPILWTYTYNFERCVDYSSSARTVYDWIDDLDVFEYDRAFLERSHERALREADVVASVARRLHERAVAVRPDALYLPNGVEYEHFAGESIGNINDSGIDPSWFDGKPLAGYYGAMAEWFDYELLEATVRQRPDWNFLLIGPMYDDSLRVRGKQMLRYSNLRWIGPRHYQELPKYLGKFTAATIPFVINDITLATSPLKLFEYFAGGKPVISTPMPECEAFTEVHIVRTAEDFSAALDKARAEEADPEFRGKLRNLGRDNSWSARVQVVLDHIGAK